MFIYNETSIPFSLESGSNNIGLIYKNLEKHKNDKIYKKRNHLLLKHEVIDTIDENKLKEIVNTVEPVKIMDNSIKVHFCKKDLAPIISIADEGAGNSANLLLASIKFSPDKKIIGIENHKILLLNSMIFGNDFIFSASFTNQSRKLVINIYDSKENKLLKYIFEYKNNQITTSILVRDRIIKTPKAVKIKTYVPNYVTQNIIAYHQDMDMFNKTYEHQQELKIKLMVHSVDNKCIESTLVKLKENNIRAITIFVNSDKITDEVKRIYNKLFALTNKHCAKIIILFNTGVTTRFNKDIYDKVI